MWCSLGPVIPLSLTFFLTSFLYQKHAAFIRPLPPGPAQPYLRALRTAWDWPHHAAPGQARSAGPAMQNILGPVCSGCLGDRPAPWPGSAGCSWERAWFLSWVLCQLPVTGTQVLRESAREKEGVSLAHCVRGVRLWLLLTSGKLRVGEGERGGERGSHFPPKGSSSPMVPPGPQAFTTRALVTVPSWQCEPRRHFTGQQW